MFDAKLAHCFGKSKGGVAGRGGRWRMWGIWRSVRRTLPKPAYSLNSFIYIKFLSQETQCTLLSLCLGVLLLLQLRHLHQLPLSKKLRALSFLCALVFYSFLNYIIYINFLTQKNSVHSVSSVPWCFIPPSTTSSTSTSSLKKTSCTLFSLCLGVLFLPQLHHLHQLPL